MDIDDGIDACFFALAGIAVAFSATFFLKGHVAALAALPVGLLVIAVTLSDRRQRKARQSRRRRTTPNLHQEKDR